LSWGNFRHRRVNPGRCPCGVRNFPARLVSAVQVADHVPPRPAEFRCSLDDQRPVRGWICEQPDVLQRIAVQHDHIRMGTAAWVSSWPSARSSSAATHVAARSPASVPRCSRPSTRAGPRSCSSRPASSTATRPSTCPRRAGTATQKRHECMQRRVDPGQERQIVG
jgi:hypothetical protein